ncbi:MAG: hypothetical protein ACK5BE_05615, partial [Alphaproteobacteria bacterium]
IHKQGRAWITDKFLQETPLLWIAASGFALLAMTGFPACSFINENWYKLRKPVMSRTRASLEA